MAVALKGSLEPIAARAHHGLDGDVGGQIYYLPLVCRAVRHVGGEGVPVCLRTDGKVGLLFHDVGLPSLDACGGLEVQVVGDVRGVEACLVAVVGTHGVEFHDGESVERRAAEVVHVEGEAQRVPRPVGVERAVAQHHAGMNVVVFGDDVRVAAVVLQFQTDDGQRLSRLEVCHSLDAPAVAVVRGVVAVGDDGVSVVVEHHGVACLVLHEEHVLVVTVGKVAVDDDGRAQLWHEGAVVAPVLLYLRAVEVLHSFVCDDGESLVLVSGVRPRLSCRQPRAVGVHHHPAALARQRA